MNAAPSSQAVTFKASVDLNDRSMSTILLKFYFTNVNHIPVGIPQQERKSDQAMDRQHAQSAADTSLGRVGRFRQGRVDTGDPVVRNLGPVQVRMLRASLRNAGCGFVYAHWYYDENKGKYVVAVQVAIGGNLDRYEPTRLSDETIEGLRQLSRFGWGFCHIWKNSPAATGGEGTYTVNLMHLRGEQDNTRFMLAVRGGHVVALPFENSED
ncbi:MAG TPA: hypothetical protein VIR98_02700 [Candidatus Paceibacterota bacterium]|jgi:hypothetical protein